MKLALLQSPSPAGDAGFALETLGAALTAAAAAGASMLVAPELFLPGYNHDRIPDLAQPRGGDWHRALADLCRKAGCGLTLGYAERDGLRLYNSAVALDATGAEIAHYRKVQLYGPREAALFTAGDAYCSFDLNGTPAALMICYDVEFAPHVRALAERGVRLILCPTANMEPWVHVARMTVPVQAINHGVAIAYANLCGTEGDLDYCGGSVIVGRDGAVLASAGPSPALLVADMAQPPDPRMLMTQLADYRPLS